MSARGRGRPREVTGEDLRTIALELFAAQGYDATSLTQIAKVAGISRTTLFSLFPTKRDIVWADHDIRMKRLHGVLNDAGSSSVRDIINQALLTIAHYSTAEREVLQQRYSLVASSSELRAYSALAVAGMADAILEWVRTQHPETNEVMADRIIRALIAVSTSAVDTWANEVHVTQNLEPYLRDQLAPFEQALSPLLEVDEQRP